MKKTYLLICVITYILVIAVITLFLYKEWYYAILLIISVICFCAYVCEHARYNVLAERLERTIELSDEAFEELGKARANVIMLSQIIKTGEEKDETKDEPTEQHP